MKKSRACEWTGKHQKVVSTLELCVMQYDENDVSGRCEDYLHYGRTLCRTTTPSTAKSMAAI